MERIKSWAAAFIITISFISVLIALGALNTGSVWVLVGLIVIAGIFFAVKLIEFVTSPELRTATFVLAPPRAEPEFAPEKDIKNEVLMATSTKPTENENRFDPTVLGELTDLVIFDDKLPIGVGDLFASIEELYDHIPEDILATRGPQFFEEGRPMGFIMSRMYTPIGTRKGKATFWQFSVRRTGDSQMLFYARLFTRGDPDDLLAPREIGHVSIMESNEHKPQVKIISFYDHPEICQFFINNIAGAILRKSLGQEQADKWCVDARERFLPESKTESSSREQGQENRLRAALKKRQVSIRTAKELLGKIPKLYESVIEKGEEWNVTNTASTAGMNRSTASRCIAAAREA